MMKTRWSHRTGEAFLILLFASLCASAQRGEPARAKAESKSGAIDGRVVNENGSPHVNAKVWVQPASREGLPAKHTNTNRNGLFKVSGLEDGSYHVSAEVPAYIPKLSDTGPPSYKDGELVTLVLIKGAVITGTVTNVKGDPIVGIGVRVRMVRDENGRSFGENGRSYDGMTDDRGVYRVYGIPAGSYVVSADGSIEDRFSYIRTNVNGFANDLPTYAPSSNRESADEISVRIGEEATNVNIRYRGERGSTISGIVSGLHEDHRGYGLQLRSIVENGPLWRDPSQGGNGEFAFDGIPDGEYNLTAWAYWNDRSYRKSESIFLKVRGADIEGLELTPAPLASINGRVVLEALKTPPPECTDNRQLQFSDTSVVAWQRVTEGAKKKPQFVWRAGSVTPNAEGKLTFSDVAASEYYFTVRFSNQQWFLQSVAFAPPNVKPADATRTWTTVKSGDRLSDLTFTLAQGAAQVRGKILLAEGQLLPEKLVAYLIPAEPERADDVLRYFAAPVGSAGGFWLPTVAPGRYWVLAQPGDEDSRAGVSKVRLPDGAEIRSSLRHAAEKTKAEIEVKPCQEVTFQLPL